MEDQLLVPYCKASDFNATTGECAAPFYGPAPSSVLPPLDVVEGLLIASTIVGTWSIGFMIQRARRVTY